MFCKKLLPLWRGLSSIFLSLLIVFSMGYGIADTWRSTVDGVLGTSSYKINENKEATRFKSDYATSDDMMNAAKEHSIKQGREGFVVMKNDNNALPIAKNKKIALFGAAAWKPFMQSAGDLKAGNADRVNLDEALEAAGYTLDATMKGIYDVIMADFTETTRYGNTTITYNNGYVTSPGDMKDYQVREVPPSRYTEANLGNAASDWKSKIDKASTVAICVFARGAGESNTYAPGSAKDFAGNKTGEDPLALSVDELAVINAAKETSSRVIVLLNTGNTMEIGKIAKVGSHEVDAIGYMGIINDYQSTGIVQVLSGEYNATGALPDTYAYSNLSSPARMNFGGTHIEDYRLGESIGTDPRWPGMNIANGAGSSFGGGGGNYNGGMYIVEAEGIYVGYNYYESRYYDSIANTDTSKAKSIKGSSTGNGWKYSDEVVYTFGHGLSYLDYEQNITGVSVDKTEDGNITANVAIHNKSNKDGYFLAQLYVQQPYTEYDKTNKVEKSAVMFLNSKKINVKAGQVETVTITVPTKYLASYDYTNAKTYILDQGTYYFTAAAGAHEAVNNFLTAQGYTTDNGMDAKGKGAVKTWALNSFDGVTFSVDNGKKITNVADDADLNYWLPDTVTYLSRSDWDATYPINHNNIVQITENEATNWYGYKIDDSDKKDIWIAQMRGMDYTIDNTGAEARNVDGKDTGVKFSTEFIGVDQLNNINDEYWDTLVSGISVNEAIGAVIHGGSQSDVLTNVDNPIVGQNEGVNGIKGSVKSVDGTKDYHFNINSQTLLASSFNPELAYEWGLVEGNSGLHLQKYHVWGTGLTQRRTPYNGRNYEYISEDAMLTNRMGEGILKGCAEKGIMNGPKHMGFNDQEHNRAGISVYMNEQKMRETDLRGFQGGLEDGGGLAVMVAFNRIGATNASHHVGMLKTILREEWNFNGVVSTDLAGSAQYFNAESMIMATVTQVAEFGGNNSFINKDNDHNQFDTKWKYISVNSTKNDAELVEQARQNLKYQFYTFANSAVMNISTVMVKPWWEVTLITLIWVSAALGGLAVCAWAATKLNPRNKEGN